MDLKFLTTSQVVEITYEGRLRRFQIAAVSAENNTSPDDEKLVRSLQDLSLALRPSIWIVSWDTLVTVIADTKKVDIENKVRESFHFCAYILNSI